MASNPFDYTNTYLPDEYRLPAAAKVGSGASVNPLVPRVPARGGNPLPDFRGQGASGFNGFSAIGPDDYQALSQMPQRANSAGIYKPRSTMNQSVTVRGPSGGGLKAIGQDFAGGFERGKGIVGDTARNIASNVGDAWNYAVDPQAEAFRRQQEAASVRPVRIPSLREDIGMPSGGPVLGAQSAPASDTNYVESVDPITGQLTRTPISMDPNAALGPNIRRPSQAKMDAYRAQVEQPIQQQPQGVLPVTPEMAARGYVQLAPESRANYNPISIEDQAAADARQEAIRLTSGRATPEERARGAQIFLALAQRTPRQAPVDEDADVVFDEAQQAWINRKTGQVTQKRQERAASREMSAFDSKNMDILANRIQNWDGERTDPEFIAMLQEIKALEKKYEASPVLGGGAQEQGQRRYTAEEAKKLPKGTVYIGTDGKTRKI